MTSSVLQNMGLFGFCYQNWVHFAKKIANKSSFYFDMAPTKFCFAVQIRFGKDCKEINNSFPHIFRHRDTKKHTNRTTRHWNALWMNYPDKFYHRRNLLNSTNNQSVSPRSQYDAHNETGINWMEGSQGCKREKNTSSSTMQGIMKVEVIIFHKFWEVCLWWIPS